MAIEKMRILEGAVVDLLSAIQGGDWESIDELEAVKETLHKFLYWRMQIHLLEVGK